MFIEWLWKVLVVVVVVLEWMVLLIDVLDGIECVWLDEWGNCVVLIVFVFMLVLIL